MASNPLSSFFGGPISQGYNPPVEFGTDIALPVGTNVDLPVSGTYRADLSTPYTAVFALPTGQYEDFVHISPAIFAQNQQVAAGTIVGTVSPIFNPVAPYSVGTFPNDVTGSAVGPFASSGPHVEFGVYGNATDAMNAYGASSVDPSSLFSQAVPPSSFVPGYTGNTYIPPASSGQSVIPPPTTPDQGSSTVGSPSGVSGPNISLPNPFQSLNDLVKAIPADIGQRITFILIAIALIIVGGLIIGSGSGLTKYIR